MVSPEIPTRVFVISLQQAAPRNNFVTVVGECKAFIAALRCWLIAHARTRPTNTQTVSALGNENMNYGAWKLWRTILFFQYHSWTLKSQSNTSSLPYKKIELSPNWSWFKWFAEKFTITLYLEDAWSWGSQRCTTFADARRHYPQSIFQKTTRPKNNATNKVGFLSITVESQSHISPAQKANCGTQDIFYAFPARQQCRVGTFRQSPCGCHDFPSIWPKILHSSKQIWGLERKGRNEVNLSAGRNTSQQVQVERKWNERQYYFGTAKSADNYTQNVSNGVMWAHTPPKRQTNLHHLTWNKEMNQLPQFSGDKPSTFASQLPQNRKKIFVTSRATYRIHPCIRRTFLSQLWVNTGGTSHTWVWDYYSFNVSHTRKSR